MEIKDTDACLGKHIVLSFEDNSLFCSSHYKNFIFIISIQQKVQILVAYMVYYAPCGYLKTI